MVKPVKPTRTRKTPGTGVGMTALRGSLLAKVVPPVRVIVVVLRTVSPGLRSVMMTVPSDVAGAVCVAAAMAVPVSGGTVAVAVDDDVRLGLGLGVGLGLSVGVLVAPTVGVSVGVGVWVASEGG